MKYPLLAASCLTLGSGMAAAQSSVQLYGLIDESVSYVKMSGAGAKAPSTFTGVVSDTSNFGLRGREDLGDGAFAVFKLEHGFEIDTGADSATVFFNRESYVGVGSNAAGQVLLGSQYTPNVWLVSRIDPFGRRGLGKTNGILEGTARTTPTTAANAVQYVSPEWQGLQVRALSTFREGAVDKTTGINLSYEAGKFFGGIVYTDLKLTGAAAGVAGVASVNAKTWAAGALYDFGPATLRGWVQKNTVAGQPDASGAMLGATVPLPQAELRMSLIRSLAPGARTSVAGVGYYYFLSKRTALFANVARLVNDGRAAINLSPPRSNIAPAIAAGEDVTGFQLGIRHTF